MRWSRDLTAVAEQAVAEAAMFSWMEIRPGTYGPERGKEREGRG